MLRTAFRITCVLLLGTIILDVTNNKCFNKSLTYKYSKQLASCQVKDTIFNTVEEMNKGLKSIKSWAEQGLPDCYEDVGDLWKPFAHKVFQFTTVIVNNANLLVEQVRNLLNCKGSKKKAASFNSSPTNEKPMSITEG